MNPVLERCVKCKFVDYILIMRPLGKIYYCDNKNKYKEHGNCKLWEGCDYFENKENI